MAWFVRFAQWWLARKWRQGVVTEKNLRLLHYKGIPCSDGSVEWFTDDDLESLARACTSPVTEFLNDKEG